MENIILELENQFPFDKNSEILNISTDNTGGNIYNDVIELQGGQVLIITSDSVNLYRDLNHYDEDAGNPIFAFSRYSL